MTITKKPKLAETTDSGSKLPESAVHALIEKGRSVAKQGEGEKSPENKTQFLQLRLDRDLLLTKMMSCSNQNSAPYLKFGRPV